MAKEQNLVERILSNYDWFPNHLDINSGKVEMVNVSREQIATTTFLADPGFPPTNIERQVCSLSSLAQAMTPTSSLPPAYIFHSAFCCSTLLARALDFPGKVRSLKEPKITMDIADYIRRTGRVPEHIKVAKNLLTRVEDAHEKTLIKPTNMANNLLLYNTPLLDKSPILFLYGSLRGFLISVLKKGEEGRFMTRRMYTILAQDPTRFKDIPTQQLVTLTDLQIASMVWLLQTEIFESKLTSCHDGRMASLHCDIFLAKPAACLSAINRHFSLNLSSDDLVQLASSEVLNRDSKKQGANYNATERQLESEKIEKEYGTTLDRICQWTDSLSLNQKVKHTLSRPLQIATG